MNLPTSKILTVPAPGFIAHTNTYPATIALSPDGRYAALLNEGYGTEESGARQSIAVVDLRSNKLRDFPDDRLRGDEKTTRQSYFIGLAFSSDGKHLYASMGSTTENGPRFINFQMEKSLRNGSSQFLRRESKARKRLRSIIAGIRLGLRRLIPPASLF